MYFGVAKCYVYVYITKQKYLKMLFDE